MISTGLNPDLLAKQASDTRDIVRFKQEMDGLKSRLTGDGADKEKQLRKACENFEAVFISKLWKEMKSTVPKEGYLHSKNEDQYMSMFDREFAEKMAQSGGIGLADMIYDQLSEKLKETSRDALTGAVQLKPLNAQPMALDQPKESLPLAKNDNRMTLEDWGGNSGAQREQVIPSANLAAAAFTENASQEKPLRPHMSDVDVQARLQELSRQLEAERIKSGLLGSAQSKSGRGYGQTPSAEAEGKIGREIAEIG